ARRMQQHQADPEVKSPKTSLMTPCDTHTHEKPRRARRLTSRSAYFQSNPSAKMAAESAPQMSRGSSWQRGASLAVRPDHRSVERGEAVSLDVGVEIGPDPLARVPAQSARFVGVVERCDDGRVQGG